MNKFEFVHFERHAKVGIITLRRPPITALNADVLNSLELIAIEFIHDPAIRAIVLTGGDRAFSAGADIREFSSLADERAIRDWITRGHRVISYIEHSRKPVVAAIEGYCLGGGLELALGCHLRVAAETAELGLPEIKLGIIPGFGGTQRLPRLIGRGPATMLMLTGDSITGRRASDLGLVDQLVGKGEALSAASSLADLLSQRSQTAMASILELVDEAGGSSPSHSLGLEIDAEVRAIQSDDGHQGIAAFLEKRAARFI